MQSKYTVLLFYKYVKVTDPAALRDSIKNKGVELGLTGRVLVATEGINGTLEGTTASTNEFKAWLANDTRFSDMPYKESAGNGDAFPKLKVKVRPELVTSHFGEAVDPTQDTGTYLTADELHAWYENNEDFVLIDMRNDYEIQAGTFKNAINPKTKTFRDLNDRVTDLKQAAKDKKVVTVCTGGIRCEKASAFLKHHDFSEVYQLKDGIHTYMEKYPKGYFKGTLFVFDNRMTSRISEENESEVVGNCNYCHQSTENYANDDSVRPSIKVLCCEECFEKNKDKLRAAIT